uniref:caspase family protein n=1 Tax=Candidatus Electronema sp. TaxID=2698783 RepID=UPI0040577129
MNVDKWIEALQHPLVLAGFGLFLFAALIKPLFLNNKKLSGTAMERLLHKGMNFAFALALLAIAGGLLLSWKSSGKAGASEGKGAKPAADRSGGNQPLSVNNTGPGTVVVNTYGLTKEQYEEGQNKLLDELAAKLRNADAGQRTLLERQLQAVQEKLADTEKSYAEELEKRKAADEALAQMKGQLPDKQIKKAKASLEQGETDAAEKTAIFGSFHALVIGNQNYKHFNRLGTPLAEAKAVAEVLEQQYGFTVDLLLDKTRADILLSLSKLRKTMTKEEDSLLVYYAGNGYFDQPSGIGYWQPMDAEKDNDAYWIRTSEIATLLKVIKIKHILIVADTCYAGSIFVQNSGELLPLGVERNEWKKRSRVALTSGSMEPVTDGRGGDNSIFAKALLEVLRENKEILYASTLFDRIKSLVKLNAPQTPLYGGIPMTGHDMGDFFLVPIDIQKSAIPRQKEVKKDLDFNFLQR